MSIARTARVNSRLTTASMPSRPPSFRVANFIRSSSLLNSVGSEAGRGFGDSIGLAVYGLRLTVYALRNPIQRPRLRRRNAWFTLDAADGMGRSLGLLAFHRKPSSVNLYLPFQLSTYSFHSTVPASSVTSSASRVSI